MLSERPRANTRSLYDITNKRGKRRHVPLPLKRLMSSGIITKQGRMSRGELHGLRGRGEAGSSLQDFLSYDYKTSNRRRHLSQLHFFFAGAYSLALCVFTSPSLLWRCRPHITTVYDHSPVTNLVADLHLVSSILTQVSASVVRHRILFSDFCQPFRTSCVF